MPELADLHAWAEILKLANRTLKNNLFKINFISKAFKWELLCGRPRLYSYLLPKYWPICRLVQFVHLRITMDLCQQNSMPTDIPYEKICKLNLIISDTVFLFMFSCTNQTSLHISQEVEFDGVTCRESYFV